LAGYCWRHKGVTVAAGLAALGGIGIGALSPLITGAAVDKATSGTTEGLGLLIAALVALALIRFVSSFVRRWAGGRLSLDVQHDLRQDVFGALQRLDGGGQDRLRTGQLVSRAISDLQMVQGLLAMVPWSAGQVVLIVVALVFMIILSPILTLTALVVIPAVVLLTRATRERLFPATWAAQQAAAEVAEIVEEDVTGVRVVKGFGQEERELDRLSAGAATLYAERMRAVRLTARLSPGLQAMTALGQVGVLAFGGYLALHGSISIGTFLAFSLYLTQLVAPARIIASVLVVGQQARASVERVLEIVDTKASVVDPARPEPVPAGPLSVTFRGVRFGYLHTDPVLDGFDLHVPAGSTVALVGPSGSGKSTVSLLLPRFYDVQDGAVELAGADVRAVTMADLRRHVGVVFEEAFLFSDTITANIAYGRPDATDAEIRAAARAAEAAEFIEALPDGYLTTIGERGLTLSGGQRQRLALARAMLTDPQVLVLDDATSAVDPATEAAIHATLDRLTADRTTILIAHRRSTLSLADSIAVVDGGRVIDHGTHEELLARCAVYRALLADNDGAEQGDLDTEGVVFTETDLTPGPDGTTAALWPPIEPAADVMAIDRSDRLAAAAAGSIGRTGGGRPVGGPGAGFTGGLPATPELLAKVAALPPITDRAAPYRPPIDAGFSLARTVRPVRGLLLVALVLVVVDTAASLALPVLIRHGVDDGISAGVMQVVWVMSALALLVVAADFVVQRWQGVAAGRAGETVLYQLRIREFAHLQRLGLDFYERELAGRIMTRMTTDVDALSSFLQTGLVTFVVSIATFVGIAVVLVVMNLDLALIAFSAVPVLLVATVIFRRFSRRAYDEAREKVSAVNADLQENVAGLRVSQALGRQQVNAAGFAARSDEYRRSRMRAQTAISVYFPFVALLSELAAALVLGVGAQWLVEGTLSVGTLLAFVLYLDFFFNPIQQLSQVFDGYQQAAVGLRRIAELLDTPPSTPQAVDPVPVGRLRGEVLAEDVSFSYPSAAEGSASALRDVDLHLRPGSTVAVVGPTGAGKSTLVKLIARFYDVTSGVMRVDGVDVREYDLPAFRRRLGVVPQEPHLFSGTVRDNIAYGRPDASDAEVEQAARAVGALTAIAGLSDGFRHRVTERGRNLSAGQRQLISLARAELVEPDVLLLDEATAALDPAAEAAVLAATDRLAKGRTTVVVAHRLTTAARADRIIVMDHGRVVEDGTHADLLAAGREYARLYAGAQ
jgi:ATP-binding cassette subfamily B protein